MNRPRKHDKHLPQCVYWRHGAFWYVKAGKWTNLGDDLGRALAQYATIVSTPKGGMADLIDKALPLITHKKSAATVEQYTTAARILKRKLAEFSPRQVTYATMVKLRDSMIQTPNMANRVLVVARLVFGKAAGWGEVDANPCLGVPRYDENKRKRFITDAEWQAIYQHAGPRLQVIMDLQYATGQRITDVLSIRRSQLGEAGIEFTQKKTGEKVMVRWTPKLREVVERAKSLNETPALTLLRGKFGKAPDYRSVVLQWSKACEAAGVKDARLNDIRAKAGTDANEQGKDATALLGHTSPAMTKRYLRNRKAREVDGPTFGQVLDVEQKR